MYHFLHLHEMNTSSLQSKRQTKGKKRELSLLKTLGRRRPSHGNRCLKQSQPHGFVSNRVQHPQNLINSWEGMFRTKMTMCRSFSIFSMKPSRLFPVFSRTKCSCLCFRRKKKTVPADTEDLCQEQFLQEQRPGQNASEPQRPGQGFGNKMVISTVYRRLINA